MAPAPRILLMSHASGALLGNCPGSPQRFVFSHGPRWPSGRFKSIPCHSGRVWAFLIGGTVAFNQLNGMLRGLLPFSFWLIHPGSRISSSNLPDSGCGIDFHELGSTPPFSAGNCQPRGNMARFDKHPLDWVPRCRQPSGRKQTTFDNNVTGRLVAALCPEGGKNCSIIISRAHGIFPRAWKCRYVTALLVVQTDLRGV
ncbi:hypothetical protein B0H14DRAFT_2604293 [Mycena olivaceomarginata]|nr:hypothetical protein B0H14DRAFT_2604293 [Mycena olivaceomarginata]